MLGQGSHIFRSLKRDLGGGAGPLSEKLSKSQQRYTNPLFDKNTGNGLCSELAMLWLKERLGPSGATSFPRLARKDVIGSDVTYELTRAAIDLQQKMAPVVGTLVQRTQAEDRNLDLSARNLGVVTSFDTFHQVYQDNAGVKGFFIAFGHHSVAIFREERDTCQFYDANAGSYRVRAISLTTFLQQYNNVCLPLKWPTYNSHPAPLLLLCLASGY